MNETEIRLLKKTDVNDLYQLIETNRPRLVRYLPGTCKSNGSLEMTAEYLIELKKKADKRENFNFGILHNNNLVGMIFIKSIDWRVPKCELGYFIDQDHEGKRIMSKAMELAIQYCTEEMKMKKLFLRTGSDNIGSQRLALKLGFDLEGVLRNDFRTETDELVDIEYYGMLV